MSRRTIRRGVSRKVRVEREQKPSGLIDRAVEWVHAQLVDKADPRVRYREVLARLAHDDRALRETSDESLTAGLDTLRTELHLRGLGPELIARTLGVLWEQAARVTGRRPHDGQLLTAAGLISGLSLELGAGEGKGLAGALAVACVSLSGVRSHWIAPTERAAEDWAKLHAPLLESIGLTTRWLEPGQSAAERRTAHRANVVVTTLDQLAGDLLRDELMLGEQDSRLELRLERLAARGDRLSAVNVGAMRFAVVDDAERTLLEAARRPFIVASSMKLDSERNLAQTACAVAQRLDLGRDFTLERADRRARLEAHGRETIETWTMALSGEWPRGEQGFELVEQALVALHILEEGRDYEIARERVILMGEFGESPEVEATHERRWVRILEYISGVAPTSRARLRATVSIPSVMRRFQRFGALSAVGGACSAELRSLYGLVSVGVPARRESLSSAPSSSLYCTSEDRARALSIMVEQYMRDGRAILISAPEERAADLIDVNLQLFGTQCDRLPGDDAVDLVVDVHHCDRVLLVEGGRRRLSGLSVQPGTPTALLSAGHHSMSRDDLWLEDHILTGDENAVGALVCSLDDAQLQAGTTKLERKAAAFTTDTEGRVPAFLSRWLLWRVRNAQRAARRQEAFDARRLVLRDEMEAQSLAFAGRTD